METPEPTTPAAAKTAPAVEAHVGTPLPPPTWFQVIWRHISNWLELWLWVPLSLLSIWLFSQFAYLLTGRRPQENLDWIVGLGGNLVKCVFVILFLSITRQQTGVWYTKEELISSPEIYRAQAMYSCVILIVFAYLLSH